MTKNVDTGQMQSWPPQPNPTTSEDKLTPEERVAVRRLTIGLGCLCEGDYARIVVALDRLAPAPKPPEPRVSELPARWRAEANTTDSAMRLGALADCANELEATLKRESTRLVRCPVCAESYEADALLEAP